MNHARRPLAILTVVALILAARASAEPAGFAFLEVPAGARASALGGAYSTWAEGAEAAFWNPAGLADVQGIQIVGSHYEFFQNLRHDQFAVAGRLLGGGVATALRALYSEAIVERDDLGNEIGTFGGHDLEFSLAYGLGMGPGLRAGGSAQIVRERIANSAATTYAFGAGTTWEPARNPGLRFGLSAQHLGPAATYVIDGQRGGPVSLPAAVQLGASYGLGVAGSFQLRGSLEGRLTRGRGGVAMLGAELAHPMGAALRLGLRANDETGSFSLGAGYAMRSLRMDYAFVPYRLDLGDTHRMTLGLQF